MHGWMSNTARLEVLNVKSFVKRLMLIVWDRLFMMQGSKKKMTQTELAQKIGTNKSYISKIENGTIEPGVGLFLRILDALGLRFDIVKPMM